jgi:hypothetical protein
MRHISAIFVLRLLSNDQKAYRVSVCRELKQQARDDPAIISSIITGDERWVYGFDPETKQQSSQWKSPVSPRPEKACHVRSNVKSMLIFFRHPRHCPQGIRTPRQTVNGKFYCEVLKRLREGIRRKRPDKWKNYNWFLHYDNAPAHKSLVVRQFLTSKNITVILHPRIRLTSPPATISDSPR